MNQTDFHRAASGRATGATCPICVFCIWPGEDALGSSKKLFSHRWCLRGSPPSPRDRGVLLQPALSSVAIPMPSREQPRHLSQLAPGLPVRIPPSPHLRPPRVGVDKYWPASQTSPRQPRASDNTQKWAACFGASCHVCCQIAVHTLSVLFLRFRKGEHYPRSPKTLQCHGG